jgi:hypothetical protein
MSSKLTVKIGSLQACKDELSPSAWKRVLTREGKKCAAVYDALRHSIYFPKSSLAGCRNVEQDILLKVMLEKASLSCSSLETFALILMNQGELL